MIMKISTKKAFLISLLPTTFLVFLAFAANAGELRVTVDGIRSQHGSVLIGLYDSLSSFNRAIEMSDKDGFLNDPSRLRVSRDNDASHVIGSFNEEGLIWVSDRGARAAAACGW
ncbi:hypothetical protein [Azospirillum canadense]|uniref:hypothetical protein n=1 Tax=Azospirillum canadense TaxID=403962 RepID=UPI002227A33C|nr:hypothetical protein [Azospirillum canadense]MCW2243136.1 uncharacterized protein (DUF2141 family) [Azospirillum canadense]